MTKTLWLSPFIALTTAAALSGAAFAQAAPKADTKAAPKPAAKQDTKPAEKKADPTESAVLLGQFGDWGAYRATPGGKKVCFALAKPSAATTQIDSAGLVTKTICAASSSRPVAQEFRVVYSRA